MLNNFTLKSTRKFEFHASVAIMLWGGGGNKQIKCNGGKIKTYSLQMKGTVVKIRFNRTLWSLVKNRTPHVQKLVDPLFATIA